jgi:hypothetical protein
MSLKEIVKVANYYEIKYNFFKKFAYNSDRLPSSDSIIIDSIDYDQEYNDPGMRTIQAIVTLKGKIQARNNKTYPFEFSWMDFSFESAYEEEVVRKALELFSSVVEDEDISNFKISYDENDEASISDKNEIINIIKINRENGEIENAIKNCKDLKEVVRQAQEEKKYYNNYDSDSY